MQTIQLRLEVTDDRSLTIPLPPHLTAGLYDVVVVMQPWAEGGSSARDWVQCLEDLAVFRAKVAAQFEG